MTIEEFKRLSFDDIDQNDDGQLSREEVRAYFKNNLHVNDGESDEFFNHVDTNNNGSITRAEWTRALNVLQCQQRLD